jgi:hypothetical protein
VLSHEQIERARRRGRRWAEDKADVLEGSIPAVEWPDVWRVEWDGELSEPRRELAAEESRVLRDEAHHAARDRWLEIVIDRRRLEDVEDEDHDEEARAFRLVRALRDDLPEGLRVDHDGPRVFVADITTGNEMTIESLSHAWKVVEGWKERLA